MSKRPRRSSVNNFNPRGWWILYTCAGLGQINLRSVRLKCEWRKNFECLTQLKVDAGVGDVDFKRLVLMKGTFVG